ncbi:hypothetical protein COW81_02980 [Candidatus Campbellbacteria bacterium CG22_combo_CG10-13_8_21_14_all_36_13]|uniref:CAAX prenyl protease 2/Lysostaphin resistance protein A-like domain-containing protein n=1 Tax=Candidatus Campbellbacteria bacterium CG22_combo_CG10-13_8_21_14_all_36_13 TaxID=1974529 RepID=A0A2H0DY61_9BACT|nr:MAG: hypothetical protein COW81_02980 [Candidatus Campbellbacteria bacterium CG22_combo_CG10-13_8_21_14_all_36_13]
MVLLAKQVSFQEYYAVQQNIFVFSAPTMISLVYYFAEEFLFRGFLFFGLWDRFKYHTFWITNVIFAIFHVGKPTLEVFFAFSLGLVLSYTSFKTKSFIPATIIHFAVALILNILVTYVFTPTNPVNLVMPF